MRGQVFTFPPITSRERVQKQKQLPHQLEACLLEAYIDSCYQQTGSFELCLAHWENIHPVWSESSSIPYISKVFNQSCLLIHSKVFKSFLKYLLPKIGIGSFEELFHLSCKVSAHFWGAHAAKSTKCQPLHILRAVIKVTVKENNKRSQSACTQRNWTHKRGHL